MDIDFVVTWVNMDDPEWQNEFAKYSGNSNNTKNGVSKARFRDYGFLKYWFRGIEKFAPMVRISSQAVRNPNGSTRTIPKSTSSIIRISSQPNSCLHTTL